MSAAEPRPYRSSWLVRLLDSAPLASAFTVASLGAVFAGFAIERMAGLVAYASIIAGLCVLGVAILVVRRKEFTLLRLVPTSLLLFMAWALASAGWTTDVRLTITGWLSLAAIAFLAVVIGHVRDTLQTVRALADVMRVLLTVSLAIEVLSGVLLDMPFRFLGIQGNLAALGPIQGIFGTRNALGFITVLALITFYIEWRTMSVRPGVSLYSALLAAVLAGMSDSPTVLVLALATAVATLALSFVRRVEPTRRPLVQGILGALVVAAVVVGYVARNRLIAWVGAGTDFSIRTELWAQIARFVRYEPVLGWGWFGPWVRTEFPFNAINYGIDDQHQSALSAYNDVLLQLGWVGLMLFLAFAGIAVARAWLVASDRRSILYAWTPLILIALLVDSLFESFTLYGYGWLMLVLCAVRAGQSRSWRERIRDPRELPHDPALGLDGDTDLSR